MGLLVINRERCNTVWDMLWVSGDEGGGGGSLVNEVERVGERGAC